MTTAESAKVEDKDTTNSEAAAANKIDLTVKIDKPGTCLRHVVVTIPRIEIQRYYQRCFEELRPRAELPGFRPGKAPRKLVESRFKDHLNEQVKSTLVMESLQQVTEGGSFSAISEPDVNYNAIEIPAEGDFTYEFKIEVRPEFDTPEWKGLKLRRPTVDITDKVIDSQLARTLSRFSTGEPVDGPAALGDSLQLNIRFLDNERVVNTIHEASVRLYPRLSFADTVVENFGELLAGSSEGEKVSTKATISAESMNSNWASKEIDVEFEILEVRRLNVDDLSPQMLAELGFDSAPELRQFVRDELGKQLAFHQQQALRKQVTDTLTKGADWELPDSLVRKQTNRELQRQALELRRSGFDDEQIGVALNTARRNATEMTVQSLREHFVLEKLAEAMELEPKAEEYDKEIELIAEQSDMSPRRIRARLEKSGQMDALRNQIVERQVIEKIAAAGDMTDYADEGFLSKLPEESGLQELAVPAAAELPTAMHDEKPEDGARPTATVKPT